MTSLLRLSLLLVVAFYVYSCKHATEKQGISPNFIAQNIEHNAELAEWKTLSDELVFGEVAYVPIYSSVYHHDGRSFQLTATLSIHNVDLTRKITILKVNYYNAQGTFIQSFIDSPVTLNPLQTIPFIIKEKDTAGGSGANFIIQWMSSEKVIPPLMEAVMISTSSQQGISFTTQAKVLERVGYE